MICILTQLRLLVALFGTFLKTVKVFKRRYLAVLIMVMALGLSAKPATAQDYSETTLEEWFLRIVHPRGFLLAEDLIIYEYEGRYYLPLTYLADEFLFFAESEIARGYASGFAGDEENTYVLDSEAGEYFVKGERFNLPEKAVLDPDLLMENDIYLDIEILNNLWPVTMTLNLAGLTMEVESDGEEMPFIRNRERRAKYSVLDTRKAHEDQKEVQLPYKENPYRLLTRPVLDYQANYTFDDATKIFRGENNINATHQIGKVIADYSANLELREGKFRAPSSIRSRFSREAVGDEDLLIPTLRRVEFGDVSLPRRDLIGNSAGGRGILLSNNGTERRNEFDRITFDGRGPPGWEVELYNNSRLIDVGVVESDGEFRFEDVVLNFGNNRIKAVLYGPQGQIREFYEDYSVNGAMLSEGDYEYDLGIVDTSRPLILLEDDPRTTPRGMTQNVEAAYGFNKFMTLFGSYTKTPFSDKTRQYVTGGVIFGTPFGTGSAEGYRQINGGTAGDLRFVTNLMGFRLNLRGSIFSQDFQSQYAGLNIDNGKTHEAEVQIDKSFRLFNLPVSAGAEVLHTETADGLVTTNLGTSQSLNMGGFRLTHTTSSRFFNEIHETSSGNFNTNYRFGDFQLRGTLGYDFHPVFELDSGNAELRFRGDNDLLAALFLQHNFIDSKSTIGGQIGYDFENLLATAEAQYRQEEGWLFTVRASTALTPFTADRSYAMRSEGDRNRAPALARVYKDLDNTGSFTDGDVPIENVRLAVGNATTRERTDENGFVVASLPQNILSNVRVDEGSISDPYLKTTREGFSTVGLRGTMPVLDFPIVETGSVDGTVYRARHGTPIQGMRIQLVDQQGNVLMQQVTAFDGYYAFEFVMPGTYTVRADPSYQVNVPPETVTVSSDDPFLFGVDLNLIEPAAGEGPAEQTDGDGIGIAQNADTAMAESGTQQQAALSEVEESVIDMTDSTTEDEVNEMVKAAEVINVEEEPLPQPQAVADFTPEGYENLIEDFQVTYNEGTVTINITVSEQPVYKIRENDDGYVVIMELPKAPLSIQNQRTFPRNDVLAQIQSEPLSDGGTRLIMNAVDRMDVVDHKLSEVDMEGDLLFNITVKLVSMGGE